MASVALVSEEAGCVGGESEVASSNQVTGETGDASGDGEIGVVSAKAEDTRDGCGLIDVAHTNQAIGEEGTVGVEIGVDYVDREIEEAGGMVGVTGVLEGFDGEIEVASVSPVAQEQGGMGSGEVGVASANQIIQESLVSGGEITASSANCVTGEVETLGGEIAGASANYVIEKAGASSGEIGVSSPNRVTGEEEASSGVLKAPSQNQVTEEADATCSEIQVVSNTQANGETAGEGGETELPFANKVNEPGCRTGKIGMDSANKVNTDSGGESVIILLASATEVNIEPVGESGIIVMASLNEVNEPGSRSGKIGMASANEVNTEPGCDSDIIGMSSANEVKTEPGCGGGEVGVDSEIQVNTEPGWEGGKVGVASAIQGNGKIGGMGHEIGAASAKQVNGEPVGMDNEVGVTSTFQVIMEAGGAGGVIGVASVNQENGEPGRRSGEFGLASANLVNEEPGCRGSEIGLASANQVKKELGSSGGEIGVASTNHGNGVSRKVGGQLLVGEKHRWVDTKVYRRRSKVEKSRGVLNNLALAPASKTFIFNGNGSQNNKINEVSTNESSGNHNNDCIDGNGVVESDIIVSIPSCDTAILKQIQPEIAMEVISNKELTSAMMESIPVDPPATNGALRLPHSVTNNKVKINLASTAKLELRELKRKFESELYSVRKAVKRIDGGREEVVREFFQPVVNSNALPNVTRSNGIATQVYSGARLLGHVPYKPNIRPFNQLRVSVGENGHGMVDSIEREKRTPKANQFYRNSEFLLANDKFPPAESNKKSKSNGKKSSGGEFGFGVGSKVYKSCNVLLEKLMKHKHGWVFNAPVDVKGLGLNDYFLIIKNPMDLGTVKAKLIKYWYKSPMEFAEDVRLTFHNAMLYNPKGHDVHIMAETLLKIFEGKWPDIEVKYLRELRMAVEPDIGYPTPTSKITNPFQSSPFPPQETSVFNRSQSMPHPVNPKPRTLTPAPSFRTPALKKPKAKDVNKRDMTYDEKQKLSTNLQSLPPEKLDGVIQIIKKRSSALSQNDDEIEVDIDSVDTETLWELDRFVSNYKKSLSKNRRKAELANRMRAEARQAAEKFTTPQPLPPKESTAGYGNANLSLPSHQNNPAANASGSGSSSSSSSSSSGSSSSDSDSDSSSEESDGGRSPGT